MLANDTGAPVSATLVANVTHGSLTLNADGSFLYNPALNYNGPDSFTYTCSDGVTTSNVGTVNITVTAVNDAPVAVADAYTAFRNTPLVVPAATGVLINDTDVETPTVSLTAVLGANPVNGAVTLNANGSFTYTPNTGYTGLDNFTYRASDGVLQSSLISVEINVIGQSPPVGNADSYTTLRNSVLSVTATTPSSVMEDVLPFSATGWKYLDNGTDQGTAWRAVGFNDASWATGAAELGYGDGDEATVVSFGPNAAIKYITTYFRRTFTVTDLTRRRTWKFP